MNRIQLLAEVNDELKSAQKKFAPFNSAHEGYAVLAEEVDELWQEVKSYRDRANVERMREEAIQVAAMALRLVVDVCDPVLLTPTVKP